MRLPTIAGALCVLAPIAGAQEADEYLCAFVDEAPVLDTWLWDCFRPPREDMADPMGFAAAAGEHVLTLTATEGLEVLFDGFVVTNDLGFEPDGTVDFVVRPAPE